MTNRTREIFDFAQMEPTSVGGIRDLIRECGQDEIEHIETVARQVILAVGLLSAPDSEHAEII